jgi:hypothetical protein
MWKRANPEKKNVREIAKTEAERKRLNREANKRMNEDDRNLLREIWRSPDRSAR